jgi:hypothetical protein
MKGSTIYPHLLFCLCLLGLVSHISAQTITTNSITPASICPGGTVTVAYSTTGPFTAGNNFRAELSNAAGAFTNPTAISNPTSSTAWYYQLTYSNHHSSRKHLPDSGRIECTYQGRHDTTALRYDPCPSRRNYTRLLLPGRRADSTRGDAIGRRYAELVWYQRHRRHQVSYCNSQYRCGW